LLLDTLRIQKFFCWGDALFFGLIKLPAFRSDHSELMSKRCEATIGIVLAKHQAKFGATGEESGKARRHRESLNRRPRLRDRLHRGGAPVRGVPSDFQGSIGACGSRPWPPASS
jgi:hypothetical protein